MATEKQIQANRNNAKHSTGPLTEQGKTRVSQNALKHGLLARDAVLPTEDPAEFEAQLAALEDVVQPGDALERELVRQIADAQWRMRRLTRLESGYLAAAVEKSRYHAELYELNDRLQPGYEGETLLLGYAMHVSTQGLLHLARYDAHLTRRFDRAIQQITRLREAREKRKAAEARPANRAGGPLDGKSPKPGHLPEPQPSASESKNQTKPNSSNHHEINEIRPVNGGQSRPVTAISQQVAPQPVLGGNFHLPIPNRN